MLSGPTRPSNQRASHPYNHKIPTAPTAHPTIGGKPSLPPRGDEARPAVRWTGAARDRRRMSQTARFQETLRRLAIFDEGFAEARFGLDAQVLDARTTALLQVAVS